MFVTRKFPPSVGGMETLAAGVWRSLSADRADSVLISHGGPNRDLVWWLPVSAVRLLVLLVRGGAGTVLTGDALTYVVMAPVARLARRPCATMVMGLDVTYPNPLYRAVVRPLLRRAPLVIAISRETAERAREVGVAAGRIAVVRLGVAPPPAGPGRPAPGAGGDGAHPDLPGVPARAVVLLTLGRLVRRKGVRWFAGEVLPHLPPEVHYAVAGEGPERHAIEEAAAEAGVAGRVHLLGRVDDEARERLLRRADLFVQPNIPVAGDMEGFGLVTVEAALRATPVVAADLEGIRDAVVDGQTGYLLPAGDAAAWIGRLGGLVGDRAGLAAVGRSFAVRAAELFDEQQMGRALAELLGRL